MARPTSRPARAALAAAAATLLATGCTGSGGADPLPTGAPPTTDPEPTATASAFDELTAADLFVAWRDAIHGLPPTPAGEVDVEAAGEGIVVPDSPAAASIASALQRAVNTGVLERGDTKAEALDLRTTGDDTRQATVCASLNVSATDLETGEPTQADLDPITDYQRAAATYRRVDGTWLLEEVAGGDPQNCVPPSIDEAVRANWEAFIAADVEWGRAGSPGDELGELADLTAGRTLQGMRDSPGLEDGTRAEREGINHDLQLHRATRMEVTGDWCLNPGRNPEAGLYEEDGTFTPMTEISSRAVQLGTWELIEGQWLLTQRETVREQDSGDVPGDHRCF